MTRDRPDVLSYLIVAWIAFVAIMMFRDDLAQLTLFVVVAVAAAALSVPIIWHLRRRWPDSAVIDLRSVESSDVEIGTEAHQSPLWAGLDMPTVAISVAGYEIDSLTGGSSGQASIEAEIANTTLKPPTGATATLFSKAMVDAHARLFKHLVVDLRAKSIDLRASRLGVGVTEGRVAGNLPLIVLGSEVSSDAAKTIMMRLRTEFEFPYSFRKNAERGVVEIQRPGRNSFFPHPGEQAGVFVDYALVVRSHRDPNVLLISGCHMWGTWGATLVLTDGAWLESHLAKYLDVAKDLWLIVEVEVDTNNDPDHTGRPIRARLVDLSPLSRVGQATDTLGAEGDHGVIDLTTVSDNWVTLAKV